MEEYGFYTEEEGRRVSIRIETDFLIKAEETLVIYVLFNLIKNAIFYLKAHPDLTITIISKIENGKNIIVVHDTGPGIPADKAKCIFDNFFTFGKKNGTGLGLSFCARTMKSFNGAIECQSELGKYTNFILSFPNISEEEKDSFENKLLRRREVKKILVVDDDQVSLMLSQSILEKSIESVSCDLALDGKSAV